jgi:hypothetical protein
MLMCIIVIEWIRVRRAMLKVEDFIGLIKENERIYVGEAVQYEKTWQMR